MYLNVSFENRSKKYTKIHVFLEKTKDTKNIKKYMYMLACLLAGWLAGLLACWLAGLLAGWLAGLRACVRACLLACIWDENHRVPACLLACCLARLHGCSVAQLLSCLLACLRCLLACLPCLLACLLACLPLPAAFNDGGRMIGGKKPGGRGKGEKKTVKIRYPSCEDPTRISTRSSLKDLCRIMQAPLKEKFSRSRHAHEHLSKAILCKNLQQG